MVVPVASKKPRRLLTRVSERVKKRAIKIENRKQKKEKRETGGILRTIIIQATQKEKAINNVGKKFFLLTISYILS